ncbi:Fur family transcriptional regulator [Rahnella variigena]|nr:Fur family transcriptional regulator [Rahnella variigena]
MNGAHNMKRRYPCQRLNPFLNSSAEKAAKYPISQGKIRCHEANF